MKHDEIENDVDLEPEEETDDDVLFDDDGAEESVQSKLKRLRDKLKRCEKEKEENLIGWQRARADFINLKKREAEARENARQGAVEEIVSLLFPLLDSFEGAFVHESWQEGDGAFKQGVESIHRQLLSVFEDIGIEEVGSEGEKFDPYVHTSVSTRPTEDENSDDTVAEVLQKGYRYHDRIIRSPKVVVYSYQK